MKKQVMNFFFLRASALLLFIFLLSVSRVAFYIGLITFCSTAGAEIKIDLAPNKTKDVAPFKLFVDASGTTATGIKDEWAYHDLHYVWDFGDSESGTWKTNGKSRNEELGATYGHVYDRPGKYTVTLTVSNPLTEDSAKHSFPITV